MKEEFQVLLRVPSCPSWFNFWTLTVSRQKATETPNCILRCAPVPRIGLTPIRHQAWRRIFRKYCWQSCERFSVANMAWFRTLKTSHLNFTEKRSVKWKFLNIPMSSCEIPGCRRLFRPHFRSARGRRRKCVCIESKCPCRGPHSGCHSGAGCHRRSAYVSLKPWLEGSAGTKAVNGRPPGRGRVN